jgi:small neutral amino acid transporter SnatA (MarC family)
MFLILTQFAVAVLAGMGFHELREMMSDDRWRKLIRKLFYICTAVFFLFVLGGPVIAGFLNIPEHQYAVVNDLRESLVAADFRIAGLLLLLIVLFIPAGVVGWIRNRYPKTRRVLQ